MKLGKRGFFPSSTTWKCCLYKDLSLIPKAPAPGVNPTPGSASRAVGITCPCLPGPGGCQEQNPSVISWKHIPKVPKVVDAEPSSTTGLGVIVAARVWSERISPALLTALQLIQAAPAGNSPLFLSKHRILEFPGAKSNGDRAAVRSVQLRQKG